MSNDPELYEGEFVCACCGSGWPGCTEINPSTGSKYTHEETCSKYYEARPDDHGAMEMCDPCEKRFMEDIE